MNIIHCFGQFQPRRNVCHQYALIAFLCWLLASLSLFTFPWWHGVPLLLVFGFAMGQFGSAARDHPLPTDEPWLVQRYEVLRRWWQDYSTPLYNEQRGDMTVFVRDYGGFTEVYDQNGELVWTEQTFDQADSDPDWRYGQPRQVTVECNPPSSPTRLSWLALYRSRALQARET